MGTQNTIQIVNKTLFDMTLDADHLHIEHYDGGSREAIVAALGVVPAGGTHQADIEADTSSSASTVEMSFHLPSNDEDAVRYFLKQQGTTAVSVEKNQLSHTATCYANGHTGVFVLEN